RVCRQLGYMVTGSSSGSSSYFLLHLKYRHHTSAVNVSGPRTRKAKITIPAITESVAIAKSSANSNRPRGNRLTNTSTMMIQPRAVSEYMAGAPGNTTRPDGCNDCKAKFMVGDIASILPVRG